MDGHRQMDWVQRSVQPVIEGCIMKTLYILKVLRILVFIYKVASMSSFNINSTKRAFYAACNSIFLHSSGIKNDMTLLQSLTRTYSLSVLMYSRCLFWRIKMFIIIVSGCSL